MYELIKVGENTYYIDCPSRMGLYTLDESNVVLIDSGSNKDAARKVLKILEENNWTLKTIINTHLHVDHIGGNCHLQKKTGCQILAPKEERVFIENPTLKPAFVYGGYPLKDLRKSTFMAKPSRTEQLTTENLPAGLEMLTLEGHSLDMVALKTSDDVWFLADSLFGKDTLEKYHICFLYDLNKYLGSLDILESLQGNLFVPSHQEPLVDLTEIISLNREKSLEILQTLKNVCAAPITVEDIVKSIFDLYELRISLEQHHLITYTIRSYLAYMYESDIIKAEFIDNKLYWVSV